MTAVVSPCVKHVPPCAKHPPLVRLIPFAKEEVAEPVTERSPVERLVLVALVLVLLRKVMFWSVLEPLAVKFVVLSVGAVSVLMVPFVAVKMEAKSEVEVAWVVVLRARFGRKRSVANVSVALIRASVRAEVKYKLEPSATLVVKRPREEVASCWYAPPANEPRSIPAAEGLLIPVPPPPAARRPASELVKVMVLPAPVIVVDAVKPWYEDDEVAKVIVGPACV